MMNTKIVSALCFSCWLFGAAHASPNFVVILADDLGWMDINPNAEFVTGTAASGQFYETPHLNRLSRRGLNFARCYSGPLCSPSRATLLTGRNGVTYGFNNASSMRNGRYTFAGAGISPYAGYLLHDKLPGTAARFPVATATGNYALPNGLPDSEGLKMYSLAEMLPHYRSAFLGKWHIGGGNVQGHRPQDFGFEAIAYEDEGWSRYNKGVRKRWHHPGPAAQADYLTDDLTALSTGWIRQTVQERPEQPFLLYLAHFAVHDPIQARAEDVAYFSSKETRGWNQHDNPAYAGMIRALDDSVGAISAVLEDLGIADNTVIVFTSDNGGQCGKKGERWTSNQPLRGQKAQVFEGGIRVPLIVSYANGREFGDWVEQPVSLEDLAPTLVALSGHTVPSEIQSQWTGQSLLPFLQQKPKAFVPRSLFIHEPYYRPDPLTAGRPMLTPATVMIDGKYKLIAFHDGVTRLYDVESDIGENQDLSSSLPERVFEMKRRVAQWRVSQVPARYDTSANPDYNPAAKNALPKPAGALFVR